MTDSTTGSRLRPTPKRAQLRTWLKQSFLSGLVVIAPFGLTVYVLHAIVASTDQFLAVLPEALRPSLIQSIPGSGLLLAVVIVLVFGFVARNLFGRMVLTWLSRMMEHIPVVATLYKILRQMTETFLGDKGEKGFKRVVLVEWPRRDVWALAFVTSELSGDLAASLAASGSDGDHLLNLFIPTTPNPTGGFHFIARERDCRATHLSVEDALKMIISCGAIMPPDHAQNAEGSSLLMR